MHLAIKQLTFLLFNILLAILKKSRLLNYEFYTFLQSVCKSQDFYWKHEVIIVKTEVELTLFTALYMAGMRIHKEWTQPQGAKNKK